MNAHDVMTGDVITATPDDTVESVVETLLNHRISAVPVIDAEGHVLGIVSEGDLLNRRETGTSHHRRARWLDVFTSFADSGKTARAFLKTDGTRASDVMTRRVITVEEDVPVADIARMLERHGIKRVPVVRDGRLVGIVSRANLLRNFAHGAAGQATGHADAAQLRKDLLKRLTSAGLATHLLSITVSDDRIELWGDVEVSEQINAARVAAEAVAGDRGVENNLTVSERTPGYGAF